MLSRVLPRRVAHSERYDDVSPVPLFPEEAQLVARAVESRRREFTSGRGCARQALAELGFGAAPILSGSHREPLWPDGVVGSLTHCAGYRGAAVALTSDLIALGVDAEPHEPLPPSVLADVARPEEILMLSRLEASEPALHWDKLLFSVKESVYKAWFPLTGKWLEFRDARVSFDPSNSAFTVDLSMNHPLLSVVSGRYVVSRGLVVTAFTVGR